MSSPILEEVRRTLETPYFAARIPNEERVGALLTIETRIRWIELWRAVCGVASHPEEGWILGPVVSSGADIPVTGDHQVLALERHALNIRDTLGAHVDDQ